MESDLVLNLWVEVRRNNEEAPLAGSLAKAVTGHRTL
jgi:hypothetical protein